MKKIESINNNISSNKSDNTSSSESCKSSSNSSKNADYNANAIGKTTSIKSLFYRFFIVLCVLCVAFLAVLRFIPNGRSVATIIPSNRNNATVNAHANANGIPWYGMYLIPGTTITQFYMTVPVHTAQRQGQLSRNYMRVYHNDWRRDEGFRTGSLMQSFSNDQVVTVSLVLMFNNLRFEGEVLAIMTRATIRLRCRNSHYTHKSFVDDIRFGLANNMYQWLLRQSNANVTQNISMSVSFDNVRWVPLQFDNGFIWNPFSRNPHRDVSFRTTVQGVALGYDPNFPVDELHPDHENFNPEQGGTGNSFLPRPPLDPENDSPPEIYATGNAWERFIHWLSSSLGISVTVATGIIVIVGILILLWVVKK